MFGGQGGDFYVKSKVYAQYLIDCGRNSAHVNRVLEEVGNMTRDEARKSKPKSKGLIPRQRNSSRETVYTKYGWLHMNNSIEFNSLFASKKFASPVSRIQFYSLRGRKK